MPTCPTPSVIKLRHIALLAAVAAGTLFVSVHPTVFAQETTPVSTPRSTPKADTFGDLTAPADTGEVLTFISSPPREELKGKPGDTLQSTLRIKNVTDKPQLFRSQALDFIVGEDGKTPIPVNEQVSGRWSSASWMEVSPKEVLVPANGSADIQVVIQIPQDALPGGHYAMVLHSPQAEEQAITESTSAVTPRSGTLFYLTVEGEVREEAFIRNFLGPKWVEFGPVPFTFSVENQSDVHISPAATLAVKDVFGRTVGSEKVSSQNIFPYTSRNFSTQWDTFWGFGPYQAELNVAYGTAGKAVNQIISFWIIPYRVLLALGVLFLSLWAILIAVRRHLHHRNNIQTQQIEILEERIKELEKETKRQSSGE